MSDVATQAWLDQEDRHVAEVIRRCGCFIQYVLGCLCGRCGDKPAFAYSVGLFGLAHPELLVFGVRQETAAAAINELFARVKAGQDLLPGELITFEDWPHQIVVEDVPNPGEIVFAANQHYERPAEVSVPVYQLTWDDRWGRFPWDQGYAVPAGVQPRPGEFRA